jgi:hypothetical protein
MNWSLWNLGTPTPTPRPVCMSLLSDSWLLAMPSTTTSTFISSNQIRRHGGEWIAALDKIESLNPRAVVASHKRPERDDDPRTIEETRQYIRDFDRLAETTTSALDLYNKMLELYPNRVNPSGWSPLGIQSFSERVFRASVRTAT